MSSSTEQGNQRKEEKMMSKSHLKPTVSKKGKTMTVNTTKQRKQRKEWQQRDKNCRVAYETTNSETTMIDLVPHSAEVDDLFDKVGNLLFLEDHDSAVVCQVLRQCMIVFLSRACTECRKRSVRNLKHDIPRMAAEAAQLREIAATRKETCH
jgi:hypothetical protein